MKGWTVTRLQVRKSVADRIGLTERISKYVAEKSAWDTHNALVKKKKAQYYPPPSETVEIVALATNEYEIVDDSLGVTAQEKRASLAERIAEAQASTIEAAYPMYTRPLVMLKGDAAGRILPENRTEEQNDDLRKHIQMDNDIQKIRLHFAQALASLPNIHDSELLTWQVPVYGE